MVKSRWMRLATIVWISLVSFPVASAKPLPDGVKVELKKGRPMVTRGGATVPLADDTLADWDAATAELSDDGAQVMLSGTRCKKTITGDRAKATIPLARLEAKLENATGEALLGKKKWADAATKFSAAMTKDPGTARYAANLLVAQVKGGKLDDADRTLAAVGKRHIAWLAWRLAVDPALAPLKARPSAAAIAAPVPGKARSATLADAYAISPLGMAATRTASGSGGSGAELPLEVSFTEIATGRVVLRLPIGKNPERALVDRVLVTLGFTFEGMFTDIRQGKSQSSTDGRALLVSGDKITYQKGAVKKPVEIANVVMVGFVPGGAVFLTRHEHVFRCDDKSYRTELSALPDPGTADAPTK